MRSFQNSLRTIVVIVTLFHWTCYCPLAVAVEVCSSCFSDRVWLVLGQCVAETTKHTPVKVGPGRWSHDARHSQRLSLFWAKQQQLVCLAHKLCVFTTGHCSVLHLEEAHRSHVAVHPHASFCPSTECSDVHLNSVAFYEAHYSQVSVVHGQQKNTNPFSELHSRFPSLRFLPLLKPPVPLGAANVSDIDPSSGSRLLLAPALHQKLRRYSSVPLSKVV